jgi:hypothetical protein
MATNCWKNGSASNVQVAPSTSWGGTNNGPTGSGGNIYPIWILSGANKNDTAWFTVEGSIGWAADAAGGAIAVLGWEDNL